MKSSHITLLVTITCSLLLGLNIHAQEVAPLPERVAPNPNPEVNLTKIHFPVLALNGENDRPLAKTHRM